MSSVNCFTQHAKGSMVSSVLPENRQGHIFVWKPQGLILQLNQFTSLTKMKCRPVFQNNKTNLF